MSSQEITIDQMIEECQPMLLALAKKIHRQLPPHVQMDDVIAYGQLGLAQAARSFRGNLGVSFSTFAYYRIRGSIYDGLATMNMANNAAWKHYRSVQAAHRVFAGSAVQPVEPTIEEDASWVAQKTRQLAVVYLLGSFDDERDSAESIADPDSPDPARQAEIAETYERLRHSIEELPMMEREIVISTYFEGRHLNEFAERFDKSKSWATRLHQKALHSLSCALKD